jgi:hypothetical protein
MICSPRLLPSLDHLIEYPAISLKCLFDVTPGLITSLPELRLLKVKESLKSLNATREQERQRGLSILLPVRDIALPLTPIRRCYLSRRVTIMHQGSQVSFFSKHQNTRTPEPRNKAVLAIAITQGRCNILSSDNYNV